MINRPPSAPKEDPPPIPRSRIRRLARRLGIVLATLALLLVVAEIAVRLFSDTIPPLTVRDTVVGQRYKPFFDDTLFIPEGGQDVHLRFNSVGFRGPERPVEKPAGVKRIAVLGDSMIASIAVAEEDTLVAQLERLLTESHPDENWEVLNFGVSGSAPGQALALYREEVRRFSPDIVLSAFFVGNDLADNCNWLSHAVRIYFDLNEEGELVQLPHLVAWVPISRFLNDYSRFYVWQKVQGSHIRRWINPPTDAPYSSEWVYCREKPDDVERAWTLTGAINEEFAREVEADGARFAVLMIPTGEQVYSDSFAVMAAKRPEYAEHYDPDYPAERMRALAEGPGVRVIDMTDDFRQAAPSASVEVEEEWLFWEGRGHFNEGGNHLAARVVHRELTRTEGAQGMQPAWIPLPN